MGVEFAWVETEQKLAFYEAQYVDRILAPCNYCLHPSCVDHKSYHNTLLIMFSCDGISDHASWNEVFHYWDTRFATICEQDGLHAEI